MSSNLLTSEVNNNSLSARSDLHLLRKVWHMATGLFGLLVYSISGLSPQEMALCLFLVAIVALACELTRLRFDKFNQLVLKLMGPFMRESERDSISGFPYYALGTSVSLYFFDEKLAILGILFLIFADPISSAIGISFGKNKIFGGKKSLEGAAAGFLTCFIISFFYTLEHTFFSFSLLGFSFLAGLIGSTSELLSIYVDDNLTVPILSTIGLTALNGYFFLY